MRKSNIKTVFAIAMFFGAVCNGFAQDEDPGFGFEGDPAAPIEQWLIPLAILGLAVAFYKCKKFKNVYN